jgi:hypothetical protein
MGNIQLNTFWHWQITAGLQFGWSKAIFSADFFLRPPKKRTKKRFFLPSFLPQALLKEKIPLNSRFAQAPVQCPFLFNCFCGFGGQSQSRLNAAIGLVNHSHRAGHRGFG